MKKTTKKAADLLCLCALLLVTSCGQNPVRETEDSVQTGTSEAVTETSPLEALPSNLDFGGYAFHVLYVDELEKNYETYISMEEENGDILWDNAYRRNRAVEERFNVDLQFIQVPAPSSKSIVSYVNQSVMAGDDEIQYIQFSSAWDNATSLIAENALYNILELPYLDPYGYGFYGEVNRSFTINERLYFAFSNYNNSGGLPLYMVFNKNMIEDYGLDMPYDIILSGGWTMDVLNRYIKGVSSDIDGDGEYTGLDRHGFASGDVISNYLVWGADVKLLKRDERGAYIPNLQNESFINAVQSFLEFKLNNADVFICDGYDVTGGTGNAHVFLAGNTMFAHTGSGLSNAGMRAINTFDFGVAPFPKYDENQERYGNYLALNQFGIPQTITEPEIVGAISQALAVTSQAMFTPVFLDVYLESKLLRDEESVQVIDMMRSDPIVDITRYYDFADGTITPVYLLSNIKDSGSVVSKITEAEQPAKLKAEEFFAIFYK